MAAQEESMDQVSLTVKKREKTGKGGSRKIRRDGFIPAVVYGKSLSPVAVSVPAKRFISLLEAKGHNVILNLEIEGEGGAITSVLKELQREPVSDQISHLDFVNINLTEEMVVHVPLKFMGDAAGVKDGGIFEPLLRELEVSCLPTDIPSFIEVDVSALTIGHSLHVSDVKAPENVTVLTEAHETVVTIAAPAAEEEVAAVAAAPVEGEASAEPELIRVKREEKEEEEKA